MSRSLLRTAVIHLVLLLTGSLLTLLSASAQPPGNYDIIIQPNADRRGLGPQTEVAEVRIAQQFGLAYLPLLVMRQHRLIEQEAQAAGLGTVRVIWARYPSGTAMNEALLAGLLDFAAGEVTPLLQVWARSQGRVRGVAALSSMPLALVARNRAVRSVADLTASDRIALPALPDSDAALLLRLAAAQAFGESAYARLDAQAVALNDRQALALLNRADSDIAAVLTAPPYSEQALSAGHQVTDSYALLGGPASAAVLWAREDFRDAHPRTYRAVYEALKKALALIAADPHAAAEIYVQQADPGLDVDFVRTLLQRPDIRFTLRPQAITAYARFLAATGQLAAAPADWQAVFFPDVYPDAGP